MDATGLFHAGRGYLDTANYGLPPRRAVEILHSVLADWQTGRTSWEPWDEAVGEARERFARLVNVTPSDVAVGGTVSEQLGLVAAALPPGSKVVVPEVEFSSNLFPWLAQEERGVKVHTVPLERLAEAIDGETTLVAFSLVQSASGEVAPLAEIVAAARHHGAFVAADGTQACGWLPIDASQLDALAVHSYKWLMSPRGASLLVLSPELRSRMRPLAAGWYAGADTHAAYYGPPLRLAADARRFATSPAWFSWVGLNAALEVVEEVGVGAIHEHDVALANRLREGLGLPASDSAVVSAEIAGAEGKLARAGIRASVRAGRTRLSCHLYTTEQDVDLALEALVAT